MSGKSLGILLTTSPEHENSFAVIKIARAALAKGVAVKLFLLADGIYNCFQEDFLALSQQGAQITICEQSAKDRNIAIDAPAITRGSLYDLACFMSQVDRFLSFT